MVLNTYAPKCKKIEGSSENRKKQERSKERELTDLLVIHDPQRGGHNYKAELTGRQQVRCPLLDGSQRQIKSRGDHAALVNAPDKFHHHLSTAVVIDDLELPNISCTSSTISCRQHRNTRPGIRTCVLNRYC
eukprot:1343311-Rhodomonas_salina.2